MNDDEKNEGPQPWIDPALEARVVAGVLGETSAFEASELERILIDNPELAIFKRRIQAVHALVGAAVRPEQPKIQLSPTRRQLLLEKLGARSREPKRKVFVLPRPIWWSSRNLIAVAASMAIGAIVVILFGGTVRYQAVREPDMFVSEAGFLESTPASNFSDSFQASPPDRAAEAKPMDAAMLAQSVDAASGPQAPPPPPALVVNGVASSGGAGWASTSFAAPVAAATPSAPRLAMQMAQQMAEAESPQEAMQELRKEDDSGALGLASAASNADLAMGEASAATEEKVLGFGGGSGGGAGGRGRRAGGNAVDSLRFESDKREVAKLGDDALSESASDGKGWAEPQNQQYAERSKTANASKTVITDLPADIEKQVPETEVLLAGNGPRAGVPMPQEAAKPLSETAVAGDGLVDARSNRTARTVALGTDEIRDSNGRFEGYINYGSPITTSANVAMAAKVVDQPVFFSNSEFAVDSSVSQDGDEKSAPQATVINAFSGGWGKGSGAGRVAWNENAKHQAQTMEQDSLKDNVAAKVSGRQNGTSPSADWDSSYMFRGVNVLKSATASATGNTRDGSEESAPTGAAVQMDLAKVQSSDEEASRRELNDSKRKDLLNHLEVATKSGQQANVQVTREFGYSAASGEDKQRALNQPGKPGYISEASAGTTLAATNSYSGSTVVSGGKLSVSKGKALAEAKKSSDAKSEAAPVPGDIPVLGRLFRSESGKDREQSFQTEIRTAKQPFSTFSLHVSDVSFQLAKEALAKGTMPDPDRIRAEEFYNAFDYNDPSPAPGEEVACRIEQCAHPFVQDRDLVRIALKVAAAGRAAGQPLRLTILLDTSGSMEREDRAASVRKALGTLASLLGPNDRVTLIGFARTPRLLAEQVPGDQANKLVEIAARTPSEGGTNLEQALALASEQALKQRLPAAQNRIVLLTDGAANLGNADPARLARQIEKTRQQGISFDACGVGANGLNDEMLEALTRKGDGRYYFLNRPEDADAGFARQLAGALRPAAENVKVQVVFNPARVSQYRLIGFEKHLLKKEDFRNDKVQAAELSAEEAGVALYQVQTLPEGEGELGEVFVRFRDPATGQMVEHSWTMPYNAKAVAYDSAPPSMQLAATAALLAEQLRGDSRVDLNTMAPVITNLRGRYPHQAKVRDLIRMFETMRK